MVQKNNPKIFISYSWTPIQNKEKTIAIAQRLVQNGVDVVLDVWDLKEGQDKYSFMEQMVNSKDIDRVLIICNCSYVEKANKREGGVGTESLIISEKIYNNAAQTKFVPIILEKDDTNLPYLPTYISSRIFIDLSDLEYFDEEFEKLLRNLFEKPNYEKPTLGVPPSFLTDSRVTSLNFSMLSSIKSAILNEKSYSNELIIDYFEKFIKDLDDFKIDINNLNIEIDVDVEKKIKDLEPHKNEFLELVRIISRYSKDNLFLFHKFFEKFLEFIISFESSRYPSGSIGSMMYDHFYFLMNELFLSFSTILIEKELFDELSYVLHTPYVIYSDSKRDYLNLKFVNISSIPSGLNSHRQRRLGLNNINEVSRLLRERSKGVFKNDNSITETDALLYYISCLTAEYGDRTRIWFPHTCDGNYFEVTIIKKLQSLTHFDKVKTIFKVNNKKELAERIKYVQENKIEDKLNRFYYELGYVDNVFNLNEIGKNP